MGNTRLRWCCAGFSWVLRGFCVGYTRSCWVGLGFFFVGSEWVLVAIGDGLALGYQPVRLFRGPRDENDEWAHSDGTRGGSQSAAAATRWPVGPSQTKRKPTPANKTLSLSLSFSLSFSLSPCRTRLDRNDNKQRATTEKKRWWTCCPSDDRLWFAQVAQISSGTRSRRVFLGFTGFLLGFT